ncbi:MAG: glycosyltransferase [Defluviitaleaceae bacterium]|nr:glycosyltransferase [Defluviitaleaceae bacterium]
MRRQHLLVNHCGFAASALPSLTEKSLENPPKAGFQTHPRIKVIHVISDTNIGGAGRCLLNLLECFDYETFDVQVIVPQGALLVPEIERPGVKCIQVQGMSDKSFSASAIMGFVNLFRELKPDIVHTHAALSARIAAKIAGAKVVHTRHSAFDQPQKMKTFPRKQINGFVNRMFGDCIISVSPAATANLVDTGTDPRMITLIYNGVKPLPRLTESERNELRASMGFVPDDFVAAIIARLSPEKGHDCVLDAAKLAAGDGIKFAIAGSGVMDEHIRCRIEEEGITNVRMLGFLQDVRQLENIMDVQVNASIGAEATSLSLLEGMSLGVPAVVSDSSGNPYVVHDGVSGLVVKAGSASELAQALRQIKKDAELRQMLSSGALNEYEQRFTAERMTQETMNLYRRLMKV